MIAPYDFKQRLISTRRNLVSKDIGFVFIQGRDFFLIVASKRDFLNNDIFIILLK